jgi:nitrate reductase NapE component
MASEQKIHDEAPAPRSSRRAELATFVMLAVLIWPVIAVGFVGAYGFPCGYGRSSSARPGRLARGSNVAVAMARHAQGAGRSDRCRHRRHQPSGRRPARSRRRRGAADQVVQGALPLLRHRLRRHGRRARRPGRRHPRRHAGRGQSRPQLRQGLLPVQDHVRRGPADPAAAAQARTASTTRRASSSRSPGTRPST